MKTRFASSIRLPLLAGALALTVAGCGTMSNMHRSADRAAQPAGYVGPTSSMSTPSSVDPFSASYASFPASGNESAGISGHSYFCGQHYNQPGCQTFDSTRDRVSMGDRSNHHHRGNWRDSTSMNTGTDAARVTSSPNRY